jgi:N-glycosyltransferase
LDPAIAGLPADRPFVLAALGTNTGVLAHGKLPLPEMVEAFGALPVTAVVALGSDAALAEGTGPRPDNVRLASFAQQRLLLPSCDLFITHAGFGSVQETLTPGVPTVALPQRTDQPANAQRLADLGPGITLAQDQVDTATLTAACRRVLEDSSYRHATRGFQRQILGLPGIDALVADLNLVGQVPSRQATRRPRSVPRNWILIGKRPSIQEKPLQKIGNLAGALYRVLQVEVRSDENSARIEH